MAQYEGCMFKFSPAYRPPRAVTRSFYDDEGQKQAINFRFAPESRNGNAPSPRPLPQGRGRGEGARLPPRSCRNRRV